jgi:hypothetical protein
LARGDNSYRIQRAQTFLGDLYPDETHNAGGDCINPKCDYHLNQADRDQMDSAGGWFTCPKCDKTYNYYDNFDFDKTPGGRNRVGLTPGEMGQIGETIIERMKFVPGVGKITWVSTEYNFPIDMIIGEYGVEIKTNHSEAQPRFKLGGGQERQAKIKYCEDNNLKQGFIGVRLNFYTDQADIFFRPQFTDTFIGQAAMTHIGSVNFADLNPFRDPEDVPPPSELPTSDEDDEFAGVFAKTSWWTYSDDSFGDDEAKNVPHQFWGFRWGWNDEQNKLLVSDQDYYQMVHDDMLDSFDVADRDQYGDSYDQSDLEGTWLGYGVVDLATNIMRIKGLSWDYDTKYDVPQRTLDVIKQEMEKRLNISIEDVLLDD